jgi:hypothetical protein
LPGVSRGKWFAESAEDATASGRRFASQSGIAHDKIVEVSIPADIALKSFRIAMLDRIGPARFATLEDLKGVSIRECKA